jgi:hypothetical protein
MSSNSNEGTEFMNKPHPEHSTRPEEKKHKRSPFGFKPDRRGAQRADAVLRRHHERLYGPCIALVRGVDVQGKEFAEETFLDNVSAGGLYFKSRHEISPGTRLFVVFAFSSKRRNGQTPKIAAHGEVQRVHPDQANKENGGGEHGVGIRFHHHRFLYNDSPGN